VRRDRAEERLSRRILWLAVAVVVVAGALFLVATGRWRDVYAFVVQFHQQSLWATLLIVSVPVLLIVFLRAWGVEDIPYVEEAPQLGTGRLGDLVRRIERSPRDAYGQALLIDEACEIASLVAALDEGLDPSRVRRLYRSGAHAGDPPLRNLIADRKLEGADDESFAVRFRKTLDSIEESLKGGAV